MTTLQLIGLAIVQGLTEFLPVSSSGHLVLFAEFTAFQDQGLAMDVALHIGSLLAVLIYFHKTVWSMIKGVLADKLLPNFNNAGNKLAYLIIIASIPAFIAGFLLHSYGMEWLRNPKIIGWTILGYGLLLYFADKYGKLDRTEADLTIKDYVQPDRNLPDHNLHTVPIAFRHAQICRNSIGLEQIISLRRRTKCQTLWPHCLIHLRCKPLRLDERPTPR